MAHAHTESQHAAARAALFALRASLPAEPPLSGELYVIQPDSTARSADEAAQILSAMAKPLRCEATALEGAVHLHCGPFEAAADVAEAWFFNSPHEPTTADLVREMNRTTDEDPRILFRGGGSELIITLEQLSEWETNYRLPQVSLSLGRADAEARARGAVAVMRFSPPATGEGVHFLVYEL